MSSLSALIVPMDLMALTALVAKMAMMALVALASPDGADDPGGSDGSCTSMYKHILQLSELVGCMIPTSPFHLNGTKLTAVFRS